MYRAMLLLVSCSLLMSLPGAVQAEGRLPPVPGVPDTAPALPPPPLPLLPSVPVAPPATAAPASWVLGAGPPYEISLLVRNLMSRANTLAAVGDLPRAITTYDLVLKVAPWHAEAYRQQGVALAHV